MRITAILLMTLLSLSMPLQAQDGDFPTLEALLQLDIPQLNDRDLWSEAELRAMQAADPPAYQIGDRDSFFISVADGSDVETDVELRGMTENVLVWVQADARYRRQASQRLAERVESDVRAPMQQLLGFREPAGVDGDARMSLLLVQEPDLGADGYFGEADLMPREYNPESNESELLVINLVYDDGSIMPTATILDTIAHEYQHLLLNFRDHDEESWLDEGLSVLFGYITSGSDGVYPFAEAYFEAPHTSLTTMYSLDSDQESAQYGAAGLFMIYLADRYGDEMVARIHAEAINGWRSVEKALREGAGAAADDLFADWALANFFMDAEAGYGYSDLDLEQLSAQAAAALLSFPAQHSGSLPQYGVEYLTLNARGAEKLSLQLTQSPVARLLEVQPPQGEHVMQAVATNYGNSRLTRELDLSNASSPWLRFHIWHDLAENDELAYALFSDDEGESWYYLDGAHSQGDDELGYYYTGRTGGWLYENIDLSYYAGQRILLRFEVESNGITAYRGMAIDDLRIDAIGLHDGFEAPDPDWITEGWIRSDNRLPQKTWLQIAQETDAGIHVDRALLTGIGDLTVDLQPGASRVVVAISPIVPRTSQETAYSLTANLIDADGYFMTVSRDCTLTTTHGLNFRDAPDGSKIGLLPRGATVEALDRSGGWFQVEYEGELGWVSADYVTSEGDCP